MMVDKLVNTVCRLKYLIFILLILPVYMSVAQTIGLENDKLRLVWEQGKNGYLFSKLEMKVGNRVFPVFDDLSGEYMLLYSPNHPDTASLLDNPSFRHLAFADSVTNFVADSWRDRLRPVALNSAGNALFFAPDSAFKNAQGDKITFIKRMEEADIYIHWSINQRFQTDVDVEIEFYAKKQGYFSMASTTLGTISPEQLSWGTIPGYFQGNTLNENLRQSYAYGQGIPARSVIVREKTASTLSAIVSTKAGHSVAVSAAPGTGRDPWRFDGNTHNEWRLGLSLVDRNGKVTPNLYYPVLGQIESYMNVGEKRSLRFVISLASSQWYDLYKHVVNNIYRFEDALQLKTTKRSLSDRVIDMLSYLRDDSSSMWKIKTYNGQTIGAQSYQGSVVGASKDAIKNADYGAMWMLGELTKDSVFIHDRLPLAKRFKQAQIGINDPFFQGAAIGQYYLWKSQRFTEEWGHYVEPIAVTYYNMMDVGNILLFDSGDAELRRILHQGAERLLAWQREDGSWPVAFDVQSRLLIYTDLKDYRPTFYGLLVAYKMLGDPAYLKGAREGAKWFIDNAVKNGYFLGVCGDNRFVPDFATGQSAQALMDMFDITQDSIYLNAAVEVAKFYTTSIYTHPVPTNEWKKVKGRWVEDWQIAQAGLSFEHGGALGSAGKNGPILLASHAGMFVRLFSITQDSLFLSMARAAAWGRDAFVNSSNGVASYYWNKMDDGPGRFPHHAWWQVGWITDYLVSEAQFRSAGGINFPHGFITPKVGPHLTYGFKPGSIYGIQAQLFISSGFVRCDEPQVDYLTAIDEKNKDIYVLLLNNSVSERPAKINLKLASLLGPNMGAKRIQLLDENGRMIEEMPSNDTLELTLPPTGMNTLKISYASGSPGRTNVIN